MLPLKPLSVPPKHTASCDPRPGLLWPSVVTSAQIAEEIVKFWERALRSPHHRGTQDQEGVTADRGRFVERGMDSSSRVHKERHHHGKIAKGGNKSQQMATQHITSSSWGQTFPSQTPAARPAKSVGSTLRLHLVDSYALTHFCVLTKSMSVIHPVCRLNTEREI